MKYYEIEIIEHLSRSITTKAKDKNEAYKILKNMYKNEEIVLDDSDYVETEFKELVS